ncbi:MAG: tRNA dihydrouridine synthase DusB [Smithellaceae bacterium]|nr:tRNA dihydrouridine synthase DusB [Smithellaceae bacterium]
MSNVISDLQGRTLLAPLAGVTNLPFRLVARRCGCSLCFTEMISANGLIRESAQTLQYLKTSPEDRPLGVQLFGADPRVMARAAEVVAAQKPALIDINMGCPVKKVIKTGSGAVLMKDPLLAGRIIAAVVRATRLPVSVKIRSGWNSGAINAVQIAKIAEDSGAAMIIVHGRTADQGFSGSADWDVIGRVKSAVRIPVVGNGDIRKPGDALRILAQTGCDAVMVGRGALGNPWIFQGIRQLLAGEKDYSHPSLSDRQKVIEQHWEEEVRYCGRHFADRSFRKQLLWYTRGLAGSARLRETLGKMTDSDAMRSEVGRYFRSLTAAQAEIMT